jgi:hypothetical protein
MIILPAGLRRCLVANEEVPVPWPTKQNRRLLRVLLSTAAALQAVSSFAAPSATTVLLVVPAGSDLPRVEAVRAAVAPPRALLIVGSGERVSLREGLELVTDRTFSDAPPADLLLVLPGEAPGLEEFLAERRKTARAILFLGDSPLVKRLKGSELRGALVLVGGPEAVRALVGAESASTPPASLTPPPDSPRPSGAVSQAPAPREPAPTPAGGAVSRYFSAPRPTPTPKP